MKGTRDITMRYRSLDHYSVTRHFTTLEGARKCAWKWVGETPSVSLGFSYAVSDDGIGKVEVSGATFAEVFPRLAEELTAATAFHDDLRFDPVLALFSGPQHSPLMRTRSKTEADGEGA